MAALLLVVITAATKDHRIAPRPSDVATRVIGQASMRGATCTASAVGLCSPMGMAADSAGRLYVADESNSRVLEYDSPDSNPVASHVFGQPDFTTTGCNTGGVSAKSLCFPVGVAVDASDHLYIADWINGRVLEYDSPLTDPVATRVFGQADFSSGWPNHACYPLFMATRDRLCNPQGVVVGAGGKLYVADTGNSRVLEYDNPLSSPLPDHVIGQPDFNSSECHTGGINAGSLCYPDAVALDGAGRLYVSEGSLVAGVVSRVLEFDDPLVSPEATRVYGQADFSTADCNHGGVTAHSLCQPFALALDADGRLWVGDAMNNRVLEFDRPRRSARASRVWGQPKFRSNTCNNGGISATSLCRPLGVVVDRRGNLYVADGTNNRVLVYGVQSRHIKGGDNQD